MSDPQFGRPDEEPLFTIRLRHDYEGLGVAGDQPQVPRTQAWAMVKNLDADYVKDDAPEA